MAKVNITTGILFANDNEYAIYEMYIPGTDTEDNKYFICVPTKEYQEYQIIVDFAEVNLYSLTKEARLEAIKKAANRAFASFKNIIYVIPNIDVEERLDALDYNDDTLFTKFHNRVMKYVTNAYWAVKTANHNVTLPEVVNIITDTDADKKYIDWLQLHKSSDNFIMITINSPVNNTEFPGDEGGTALAGGPSDLEKENTNTRKLIPPKKGKPSGGFSNIIYFTIILGAIAIGLVIGYLIMK